MRMILLCLSLVMLAGCVEEAPPWTRERQQAVTTRSYQGMDDARVRSAMQEVLLLADGGGVHFEHFQHGFRGTRRASVFMLIAAFNGTYDFDAAVTNGVAELRIYASTTGVSAAGYMASGPGLNQAPRLYDLYFARLNYLLGLSDEWITCADAPKKFGGTSGFYEPLCLGAVDEVPKK